MMAPAGVSREVPARIAEEFARAFKDAQFVENMQQAGVEPAAETGATAFSAFVTKEIALWSEAVRVAGVGLQ
jgi:tripartite-type tricarboxylate transporter receptor subunit TctC